MVKERRRVGLALECENERRSSLSKGWTNERGARAVGVVLASYCWCGQGTKVRRHERRLSMQCAFPIGLKESKNIVFMVWRIEAT
jgi:hypothetical protein